MRIEIAHHQPVLLTGEFRIEDRGIENPAHLLHTESLAAVVLAGLVAHRIALRPKVQHDIIDAVDLHVQGAVGKPLADALHHLDRVFRGEGHGIVVLIGAYRGIGMPPAFGQQVQAVGQVARHLLLADGLFVLVPMRRAFADGENIGVLRPDPRDEAVVTVILVVPHAVGDVVVHQAHRLRLFLSGPGALHGRGGLKNARQQQQGCESQIACHHIAGF